VTLPKHVHRELVADAIAASGHPLAQPLPKYRWRYLGDPCLSAPTVPVASLSEIPAGLIQRMQELMNRGWTKGVGIAAPQVGATQRICIITLGDGLNDRTPLVLINPKIVSHSEKSRSLVEACLSVPGFETTIARYDWVEIVYQNERLDHRSLKVGGFDAQIVQHELGHLDGKCIVDFVPRQQRRAAERMVEKFLAKRRRAL